MIRTIIIVFSLIYFNFGLLAQVKDTIIETEEFFEQEIPVELIEKNYKKRQEERIRARKYLESRKKKQFQLRVIHPTTKIDSEFIESLKNCDNLGIIVDPGTLPTKIWESKSISILSLEYQQGYSVPQAVSNLTNLESLYINVSGDSFELPESIAKLQNLRELYIRAYEVTSIPSSIFSIKSLEKLTLLVPGNKNISASISNLQNLDSLAIYIRRTDEVPPGISGLKNLRKLHLSGDWKVMPDWIGKLKKLENFYFAGKNTEIPDAVGKLKQLKSITLHCGGSYNNCFEYIPESISKLKNLESLEITTKSIKEIHPDIGNINSLQRLTISCIEQRDSFKMGAFPNLEVLWIRGDVPDPFLFPNLKVLGINYMESIDNFEWLEKMPTLEKLFFRSLSLDSLPLEILSLPKLKALHLENNNLSHIPKRITKMKSLEVLNLTANKFQFIPPFFKEFSGLKELYVGRNEISYEAVYEFQKSVPYKISRGSPNNY